MVKELSEKQQNWLIGYIIITSFVIGRLFKENDKMAEVYTMETMIALLLILLALLGFIVCAKEENIIHLKRALNQKLSETTKKDEYVAPIKLGQGQYYRYGDSGDLDLVYLPFQIIIFLVSLFTWGIVAIWLLIVLMKRFM